MSVIFYHSILLDPRLASVLNPAQNLEPVDIPAKLALSIFSGANAVLIFFVLSGLVLRVSADRLHDGIWMDSANFAIKRLCRLYPAIFFALAFCFLTSWVAISLGSTLPHFINATDLSKLTSNAIFLDAKVNGATWTLQTEVVAIPFLFAAFMVSRKLGLAGSLLCLCYGLYALWHPSLVFNLTPLRGPFVAFMAGVVIADPRLSRPFFLVGGAWLSATVLALVALKMFIPPAPLEGYVLNVLLCTVLVGGCYRSAGTTGIVGMLNTAPALYLGKISYSLYLLNVPIIWVFIGLRPALGLMSIGPLWGGIAVGILVTLCTIPVAHFSEAVIEQGSIWIGRQLSIKPRRRIEPAPAEMTLAAAPA
ncbi:acyltransferase [Mesorhizobium sp. NZP2077]|nr:acyltransferase [Mesorhizobium sp. NZP2077]